MTGKLSAFAPGATVVHLDIDAAEISKIRHADIPVVGPLKQVLTELARVIEPQPGRTEPWLRQIADWRDEFPLKYRHDDTMLKPQKVLQMLQGTPARARHELDAHVRRGLEHRAEKWAP